MSEHTPGPWVGFSDQGKCIAIMPAMREGDICTFQQPPSDADARLMILAPALVKALEQIVELAGPSGKTAAHQWGAAFTIASAALAGVVGSTPK